jgi:hypothetical protein
MLHAAALALALVAPAASTAPPADQAPAAKTAPDQAPATKAPATKAAPPKHATFRIEYLPPTNPKHQAVHDGMRKRHILENYAEVLAFLRLPKPLTLRAQGCDGESNAWYEASDVSVTVCYELVQELVDDAPKETTPAGVTREDAVFGAFAFLFLHEMGHAVFDLLHVPIFGREEDAADQFASVVVLEVGRDLALETMRGAAWMWANDAKKRKVDESDFADVHGLSAQRAYTALCLAYGSDPKKFEEAVTKKYLPEDRASGCAAEYAQASYAARKLIGTKGVDAAAVHRAREKIAARAKERHAQQPAAPAKP